MEQTSKENLTTIINSFIKVILFLPDGNYGRDIYGRLMYDAEATATNTVELSIEGYMAYIFIRVTKKRYPSTYEEATPSDIALVNDIWISLGYPDKTFQPIGNGVSN
jgi:hypothetical protein